MSMGGDPTWVGKKPPRKLGGMSDALSIASNLGFSIPPPPSSTQEEDIQNLSTTTGDKSDNLIRVSRELTVAQRKIVDLHVELQGRKDNKNVTYLTHVSKMEKKIESLTRITAILKDVIQNKDCIIARLQQPYSLDCIPVEAEYHKQFSELLLKAASDYGALTIYVTDFQWSQNFRESPTIWGEILRPNPIALASYTRYFATLQNLRVGGSSYSLPSTPAKNYSPRLAIVASGVASGILLEYEVGGPWISVKTAYGVEVEVENNPYHPSLMVFMDYRDYMKQKVQILDTDPHLEYREADKERVDVGCDYWNCLRSCARNFIRHNW
ncbi:hypothetical protein GIB67_026531 [Kingdonia uniflora]|uniref:Uncharacterized protein n=1 Tax=Kingdonia uniflora TaxID=39325 RepID=A0A7J7PCH5_9MAGN|nr:hypothetical protein GIB67_026531 [Kingdonia uniflora]